MKLIKKTFLSIQGGVIAFLAVSVHAEPLKIGYSDWPGFTIFELAKQKGWFKDAGLDVDLVWFDYLPSLSCCRQGGRCNGRRTTRLSAELTAQRAKLLPFSTQRMSDMIIGKPGIDSTGFKDRSSARRRPGRAPCCSKRSNRMD
jgi:NitT/TauT family transport system substrate-binding protein